MPQLCPHNQNPIACLDCWRAKQAQPRRPAANVSAGYAPQIRAKLPEAAHGDQALWEPPARPQWPTDKR